MLIMDGTEIKKLALGGQEFIKKPDSTDYWDYTVGQSIYDISVSADENCVYILSTASITKVDSKGKKIWEYKFDANVGLPNLESTNDGYVLFAYSSFLACLKDNGDTVSLVSQFSYPQQISRIASNGIKEVYTGDAFSNIFVNDLSIKNNTPKKLFAFDDSPTYHAVKSLCLKNNIIVATSDDGRLVKYDINTKDHKVISIFTSEVDSGKFVYADFDGNNIICSNYAIDQMVLLDSNLKKLSTQQIGIEDVRSCILVDGYIYLNCNSSLGSEYYSICKLDMNFKTVMQKSFKSDPITDIIYSKKDNALYMGHDAYFVGKYSTFFA